MVHPFVDGAKFGPFDSSKTHLTAVHCWCTPRWGGGSSLYHFSNSAVRFEGGWIDGTLNIKRGRLYWGLSDGE